MLYSNSTHNYFMDITLNNYIQVFNPVVMNKICISVVEVPNWCRKTFKKSDHHQYCWIETVLLTLSVGRGNLPLFCLCLEITVATFILVPK